MRSQELTLDVRGLVTSPNPFGAAPRGSFSVADNCVAYYAGLLESRRGFELHSTLANGSRLSSFQGKLIALAGTTLNYYNAGWNALSGSFTAPSGTRMQFLEAAGLFLLTTNAGVYVLDAYNGTARAAGVPPCFPASATTLVPPSVGDGWLPPSSQAAVRYVLGRYLPDGTAQLGAPSPRVIVQNATGTDVNVQSQVPIGTLGVTGFRIAEAGMFVREYRSAPSVDLVTDPGDELFQAVEYVITAADVTAGFVTFLDAASETGAALYTNANQEGISQANYPPPLSKGFCNYKNTTIFFGGTHPETFTMQLLSTIDESNYVLLQGDTVTLSDGTNSDTYTGDGSGALTGTFNVVTSGNPVTNTLRSLSTRILTDLGAGASDVAVRPYVDRDTHSITFMGLAPGGPALTVTIGTTTYNIGAGDLSRTANVVTVTQVGHPYRVGASVNLAATVPDADFPVGVKTVTEVVDADHWKYAENGANDVSTTAYTAAHYLPQQAWSPQPSASANFSNSQDLAAIYYSKLNQPSAVPLENNDTVGVAGKAVKAVVPLRESVLIFKEDGLYRLTGDSPANYIIQPYDLSAIIAAPETAVGFKDNVPYLATRGGEYASESTGVSSLANGAIDDSLLTLLVQNTNVASLAFGVSYESEEQYFLWLPTSAESSAPIQNCYVFHADANAWTRWPVEASHAIIDPVTNKLTLVNGSTVWVERKGYAATDYQDIGGSANITVVTDSTHITMSGPGVGDLITQGMSSARVLEASGSNLTLDTAGSWSVASATYAKAIDCQVTWLPQAGENPGTMKNFQELSLNFKLGQFTWLDALFATDVTPTAESKRRSGTPAKPNNVNIRALTPVNMARAVMINCGFRHRQALCNFQVQSSSLIYRQYGVKTPSRGPA